MLPSPRPAAPSHHSRPAGGMVISGYGSLSRRLLQSKLPYRFVHPTRNSSTSVSSIPNSLLDRRRHDDAPRLSHDVVHEKTCRGETRDAWHDTARGEGAGRTARGGGSRGLCARRCPTGPAGRAGGRARAPGAAGRTSRARGTTGTGRRGGPAAAPSRAGPWARSGAPSPRRTSGRATSSTRARAGRLGSARGPAGRARARPGSCARAQRGRGPRPCAAREGTAVSCQVDGTRPGEPPAGRRPGSAAGMPREPRRSAAPCASAACRTPRRARSAGGRPRRRALRGRGPGPADRRGARPRPWGPWARERPSRPTASGATPGRPPRLRVAPRRDARAGGPRASWRASGGPAGEARPPPRLVPVGRADEEARRRQGGHPVGPGGDGELRQHAVRPREGAAAPLVLLGG